MFRPTCLTRPLGWTILGISIILLLIKKIVLGLTSREGEIW